MPPAPENKSIPRIVVTDYSVSLVAQVSVLEHETLRVLHVVDKASWRPTAPMSEREGMGSATSYGPIGFLGHVRVLNGCSYRCVSGFWGLSCGLLTRRRQGSKVEGSIFLPNSVVAAVDTIRGSRHQSRCVFAINVPDAVGSVGSVGATCCSRVRFRLPNCPPMTAVRISPKALRNRLGSMYRRSLSFPDARFYATTSVTTRAGRCRACVPRVFLVGARPAIGHGRSRAPRSAFPVGRQGVARTIPGAHDELYAMAPGTTVAPRHARCRPRARVL